MAKKKHLKINTKAVLTIVGIAALIAAALIAGIYAQKLLKPTTNAPSVSDDALQGGNPDLPKEEVLSKEVTEVKDLITSGNTTEAEQKITAALAKEDTNDEDRYNLYIQQGVNYVRQGRNQESYDSYIQAEKLRQNENVYSLVGASAARIGKNAEAIAAYKKAITYVSKDDSARSFTIRSYQDKIRELGGQP